MFSFLGNVIFIIGRVCFFQSINSISALMCDIYVSLDWEALKNFGMDASQRCLRFILLVFVVLQLVFSIPSSKHTGEMHMCSVFSVFSICKHTATINGTCHCFYLLAAQCGSWFPNCCDISCMHAITSALKAHSWVTRCLPWYYFCLNYWYVLAVSVT